MSSKQSRFPSAPARVEMLESRRLLSASPTSHVAAALVETRAAHVHPTIPMLAGETFTGTFSYRGVTAPLTLMITFTSESTKGAIHATATADPLVATCTGTVKSNGAVTIKGRDGKVSITLTGKLSSNNNTLAGKFSATGKTTIHGSFTTSRSA